MHIIDFGTRSEAEARQWPQLFDILRDRVQQERAGNGREAYRVNWWRFGEARPAMRAARAGLGRYTATAYVARHRWFVRLSEVVAPDDTVIVIALNDGASFGVLCSSAHETWALATGTRLGVGNDPRYNNSRCFAAFPFPELVGDSRVRLARSAERLDAHRAAALARDTRVTMTGMYNVVEKLRTGTPLTPKERDIHEIAACGVLKDLHDELDALVAQAYGWPWPMLREEILERLVALHDERVAEEARGLVRWLRPDYQIPRFGAHTEGAVPEFVLDTPEVQRATHRDWPPSAVEQLTALGALLAERPRTRDELVQAFTAAPVPLVERHLETLDLMGEVVRTPNGLFALAQRAA